MSAPHGELVLGGKMIPDARDRIRRYCGLPWSGGPPETWAFRYYDLIPTNDSDRLDSVDVVATASLHPGLSKQDLAYFWDERDRLEKWTSELPAGGVLASTSESVLAHLDTLATFEGAPTISLLTKVIHRKRPRLVPLVDRHVLDWYRPLTGERSAPRAWSSLLRLLRDDLAANSDALGAMASELRAQAGVEPTDLRMVDIAIWMGGR